MKIFRATPNPDRINENHWKRSPYKGWIIVRAENERKARRFASINLPDMAGLEAGLSNPWFYVDREVQTENLVIFMKLSGDEILDYSLDGVPEILDKEYAI